MNKILLEQINILKKIIEDQNKKIEMLEKRNSRNFYINICCKCCVIGNKLMYNCKNCDKKICCDCCFVNEDSYFCDEKCLK